MDLDDDDDDEVDGDGLISDVLLAYTERNSAITVFYDQFSLSI